MKVFWSWQSDTPGKIGRFLIRDALKDAIAELKENPEVEGAAVRETLATIHLDQDIQGELRTPDLAATIFRKIEEAAVVVADVTLVGSARSKKSRNGDDAVTKKLVNSNVAIELGYPFPATRAND